MRLVTFLALFRIKTLESFQYRVAAFAGASTSIVWGLIEITVLTVFFTHSQGFHATLTLSQAVTYVWLAQFMHLMQPYSLDNEILKKIQNGDVAMELCRPLDLYGHWFARMMASRVSPLCFRGLPILLFALILPLPLRIQGPFSFVSLLFSLLSFVSALFLCTTFGTFVCIVRMNISYGDGPTNMLMVLGGVLSGSYLPLQLWPDSWQTFLTFQPFAGYLDLPLQLYLGTRAYEKTPQVLLIQWFWIAVFFLAGKLLLRKRLQSIIVQGG